MRKFVKEAFIEWEPLIQLSSIRLTQTSKAAEASPREGLV